MSRLFNCLMGENKDKLEKMLEKVEKELKEKPDDAVLLAKKAEIETEIKKCSD